MLCTLTVIVGRDPCFACSGPPQPVGCRDGPFPMPPWRCNGGEPRAGAGEVAAHEAPARATLFDRRLGRRPPGPHGGAAGPRSGVPASPPRGAAWGRQGGGAPRQAGSGASTPGTPRDTTPPPLVRL